MTRLFQIAVFSCASLLLTGCNGSEKNLPIWEDTKIEDLAPSYGDRGPGDQLLKTMNFDVYIFEMPAENIGVLDGIWQMLYTKPLRFNDSDAFGANSFLVGTGQVQMLGRIGDVLLEADGEKIKTVSLLLSDGQADDLFIARLDSERTIFYISTVGSMEGATVGPGRLALRVKAEKIPGSRGVCKVSALPVFPSPPVGPVPQLATRTESDEFLFTSTGFELKMSPGDLFFLGPEKYISNQITLGGLFFSRPNRKPVIRVYLVVCVGIVG